MAPDLKGKVCVVTGATKGIGRGIALFLGSSGAKVYITGRSEDLLKECADEINRRGGEAFPVPLDHFDDQAVEIFFDRVGREQNGQLDVLVNNAYSGVSKIFSMMGKKFWENNPVSNWDQINGIGLRGHYLCTSYGARLMTKNKKGLIVNVSSFGGKMFLFNPIYGIGKAGCDRMAADCAIELKDFNVAMVSLWPGPVKTEFMQENVINSGSEFSAMFAVGESMEFSGMAVAHLAADPNIMSKTGKIFMNGDLANEYNFVDEDGDKHDFRSVKNLLKISGHPWMAALTPSFVKIPLFAIGYALKQS